MQSKNVNLNSKKIVTGGNKKTKVIQGLAQKLEEDKIEKSKILVLRKIVETVQHELSLAIQAARNKKEMSQIELAKVTLKLKQTENK